MPASPDGRSAASGWYLRIGDGKTYGPATRGELIEWTESGRVAPGHQLSSDGKRWVYAETVPFLEMHWRVDLGGGNLFGPLNIKAVRELVSDPNARLVNTLTREETTVARKYDEIFGRPAASQPPTPRPPVSPGRPAEPEKTDKTTQPQATVSPMAAPLPAKPKRSSALSDRIEREVESLRLQVRELEEASQAARSELRQTEPLTRQTTAPVQAPPSRRPANTTQQTDESATLRVDVSDQQRKPADGLRKRRALTADIEDTSQSHDVAVQQASRAEGDAAYQTLKAERDDLLQRTAAPDDSHTQDFNVKLTELESALADAAEDRQQALDLLSAAQSRIQQLENECSDLSADRERMQETAEALAAETERAKQESALATEKAAVLAGKVASAQSEADLARQTLADRQASHASALKEQTLRLAEAEKALEKLHKQAAAAAEQDSELKEIIREDGETIDKLKKELELARGNLARVERQHSKELQELQGQFDKTQRVLEEEIALLKAESTDATKLIEKAQEALERERGERVRTEQAADTAVNRYKNRMKKVSQEAAAAANVLIEAREELEAAHAKIKELEAKGSATRNKLDEQIKRIHAHLGPMLKEQG